MTTGVRGGRGAAILFVDRPVGAFVARRTAASLLVAMLAIAWGAPHELRAAPPPTDATSNQRTRQQAIRAIPWNTSRLRIIAT